jgi:hypothetical protein
MRHQLRTQLLPPGFFMKRMGSSCRERDRATPPSFALDLRCLRRISLCRGRPRALGVVGWMTGSVIGIERPTAGS